MAAALALGLLAGGGAGAWFWSRPLNYSVWHFAFGAGMVALSLLVAVLALGGLGRWVMGVAGGVAVGVVTLTAVTSGALAAVVTVGWMLLVAAALGDWVLQRLGLPGTLPLLSRLVLAVALGLGAQALGVLGLGLAGGLQRVTVAVALLTLTVALRRTLMALARELVSAVQRLTWPQGEPAATWGGLAAAALVFCLSGSWLWALAPAVWYDELNYQLAAPVTYAREGAVVDRPEEFRFLWAHNANMLYTLAVVLGGVEGAKLVHFAFGLLAAAATAALGRAVGGAAVGWCAALFFLGLPLVSWELGVAYVDLAITAFCATALVAALSAAREGSWRWALVAGLVGGLAVGTKLNAGLLVGPLGAGLGLVLAHRYGWRRALAGAAGFAAGAALLTLPWFIRDWAWTGNPIFPYLNSVFGSPRWGLDSGWQNWHVYGHRQGVLAALLLPWDLVVNAGAFGEGLGPGAAGALLWLGLPWCVLARRNAGVALAAWGVVLPAGLLTLALAQYLRFLLPLAVPVAVVAALNARLAWEWAYPRWRRLALTVAVAVGLVYVTGSRLSYLAMLWPLPARLPVALALGLERPEVFLGRTVHEYQAMRRLDALVEPGDKVVMVGCHARLYTHARLFEAAWGHNEVTEILRGGARGEGLGAALLARGFRALVVNRSVAEASGWATLPVLEEGFLDRFGELVFAHNRIEVYRLTPDRPKVTQQVRNLLINQSFEELGESGAPRGWHPYGQPRLGGPARSGQWAALASGSDGFTQAVPITAGQVYTLGHWSRAGGRGEGARLQINWLDPGGGMVDVSIEVVPVGPQWRWHAFTVTAPPRATRANVYVSVHEDAQVWFDDLCLVAGTATAACGGEAKKE